MDDSIGGGAFGIVFSAYISRDVCKRLPYFQVHHKKLGRRGEFHRVAVKRVKGECQLILLHSILLYFNYAAMILAQQISIKQIEFPKKGFGKNLSKKHSGRR